MISTRGRYALRVMLDIAEHDDGNYIPLKDKIGRGTRLNSSHQWKSRMPSSA